MNWYIKVLKQYADFNGRARRQEYWMFVLFNIIIILGIGIISGALSSMTDSQLFMFPLIIYYLGIIIPSIAVVVRRLHDQNKSGWFYFVSFIPFIGGIWLLVLMCTEGDKGPNQYGPDPKNPNTELDDIGTAKA